MREIIHRINTEHETVEVSGQATPPTAEDLVRVTIRRVADDHTMTTMLDLDERRELVKALQEFDPSTHYRGPG